MERRDAYAAAGVDVGRADAGVAAIVAALAGIRLGRPAAATLPSGHYANVLRVAPNLGVAVGIDGVGSKVVVAERAGRLDTVGIDCVAMCANDVVCVGARPVAVLDYLAVQRSDPDALARIARGLALGAEAADVEVPGGELAELPELIRGHPDPGGFDLVGACVGTVALDAVITGAACAPGDVVIGLPSSGIHANGLTLARRVLCGQVGLELSDRPAGLGGASVADALLEPTAIYVRAVLDVLAAVPVHGLAHITGGGLSNLLRVGAGVGYRIDAPLPVPAVFELVAELGDVSAPELHEVFNMGCGFCVVVPESSADEAVAVLARRHPGSAPIGRVTGAAGRLEVPPRGLVGGREGLRDA